MYDTTHKDALFSDCSMTKNLISSGLFLFFLQGLKWNFARKFRSQIIIVSTELARLTQDNKWLETMPEFKYHQKKVKNTRIKYMHIIRNEGDVCI